MKFREGLGEAEGGETVIRLAKLINHYFNKMKKKKKKNKYYFFSEKPEKIISSFCI